jgi:hypothetical protein
MAMNISNLDIGLVVGFFGGFGTFFRGFRIYREYLLLEDTPGTPIRSVAMGLVRIHGKATSENLVNSPISHTPCCFYNVEIEKWKNEGENGKWSHYGTEADGVRFYLEDGSGRVLVDARGAEYDLERTCLREVASARASSVAARGASDEELVVYADRVGPSVQAPESHHNLEMERALLVTSKSLRQPTSPEELFQGLVGPQVAQIQRELEAQGPQSDPLSEEIRLAQIELYKHPFWSREYTEGFKRVTKLQARHRKDQSRLKTPPPFPVANDVAASVAGLRSGAGRYRFTERCILPDHEYDITGTCGENPEAKDVNDRNLIRKGGNEPTFLISGLAQPDVNVMLRLRTQFMIFGGGMLAVFCLGLLLARLGLF